MLTDPCGRPITYLRLSVTGSCGLDCVYCRPPVLDEAPDDGWSWGVSDLETLVRAAVAEGITHVRLTGGEPLQRTDLADIVRRLSRVPGVQDLGLTTNGQALAARLGELAAAGLRRINISLDSLDPDVYRRVTGGGSFANAWEGVTAALAAGLHPVKLNMVLLRGYNDTEVAGFASLARDRGLHVRFIELMPIGPAAALAESLFYPADEALAQMADAGLGPPEHPGPGPATTWRLGAGSVGVITPVTAPPCAACNRLRVTAAGRLRPCLTHADDLDLRPALASPDPEAALRQALREAVARKPARGAHLDGDGVPALAMCQVGG
jgi:GTP 3',8-cyclase